MVCIRKEFNSQRTGLGHLTNDEVELLVVELLNVGWLVVANRMIQTARGLYQVKGR